MPKTRKEKRDERAEAVCQEVRHQMSTHGGIVDNIKLFALLQKYMKVGKKSMYKIP